MGVKTKGTTRLMEIGEKRAPRMAAGKRSKTKSVTPPRPPLSQPPPSQPQQPQQSQSQHQQLPQQHVHAERLEQVAPDDVGLGGVRQQAELSEAVSPEARGSEVAVRTPVSSASLLAGTPPPARICEEQDPCQETHWLFGYGSILLESSRRSTLVAHSQAGHPPNRPSPSLSASPSASASALPSASPHLCQAEPAPAALVELSAAAGYVREWNFKAPSGFTAVGLRPSDAPLPVCGVLFEACGALGRFDAREAGYDRVGPLVEKGRPEASAKSPSSTPPSLQHAPPAHF